MIKSGIFTTTKPIRYSILRGCRLIAGISNLANEKYYYRVFLNGLIQPAPQRSGYAGLSLEF